MRWYWIDRLLEFRSGRDAKAVKRVSPADDPLDDHLPGWPVMPNTLVTEGLAQMAGLLAAELTGFRQTVVLAKIARAEFYFDPLPGDTLVYAVTLVSATGEGAIFHATSRRGDELHAEVELVLAHPDAARPGTQSYDPKFLREMMRRYQGFEVGRDAHGDRLVDPA